MLIRNVFNYYKTVFHISINDLFIFLQNNDDQKRELKNCIKFLIL